MRYELSERESASRLHRSWSSLRVWLVPHFRVPMYREGYALVLSSGLSSLLGFVYWIVAARSYSPGVVGLNSAVISAMMFLAGMSQLNLASASVRFLPAAGAGTRRFLVAVYLIALASAVAASMLFLAGVGIWTPSLGFLRDSIGFAAAFTISAMAWAVFNLQHSVLTGLRRAVWVPVENVAYSVGKLGLLVILAGLLPRWGIFASWTTALAVAVLPTVVLIFGRLVPRHMALNGGGAGGATLGNVTRYAAADYVGSLCWLASTTLVPIIVVQQAGAAANAFFSLSWLMVTPLYVISASMGSSLVVSGVFEMGKLKTLGYRMLVQTYLIVIPLAAVLIVGAPLILQVFGEDYARYGTSALRLLAIATIPGTLNTLYINVARVQRRMSRVVMVFAGQSVLVLGLTLALVKPYGLPGVGWAWVISQSVVAAAVAVYVLGSGRPRAFRWVKRA